MKLCRGDVSSYLIHTSHLVSPASNRGVLIDVVTRQGVSCRLRRERYFFQAEALRLSSVQGDDSCWQFLAPLLLSPRQVKSPPLPLSSLSLASAFSPSVSRPVCLPPSCLWETRPSSPALTTLRQCQSLPLPWRQMQLLRFNGSYFSTCSVWASFTLSVLLRKQKTVIELQCHSFSSAPFHLHLLHLGSNAPKLNT